jgi:WhiB family redox-sensing transcriptional regulator
MSTDVYTVARYLRVHDDVPDRAAEDLGWQDDTPCQQADGDIWFPDRGAAAEPAKAICRSCISRLDCLSYALDRYDEGIWGGFTERERRRLKQEAGKPLADIIADDDARHYAKAERSARPRDASRAAEARRLHGLGLGVCAIGAQVHADARTVRRWLEGSPARTAQPQPQEKAA